MFQFPASTFRTLWIHVRIPEHLPQVGFPIRTSAGRRLFAPLRSFSQLATSFFGSWCQGIRPVLFIAWPTNCYLAIIEELLESYDWNNHVNERLVRLLLNQFNAWICWLSSTKHTQCVVLFKTKPRNCMLIQFQVSWSFPFFSGLKTVFFLQ